MGDNNSSLPDDPSCDQAMVVQPSRTLGNVSGRDWPPAELRPPDAPKAQNIFAYLHAVRRHWLVIAAVGLVCGTVAGVAVWFLRGARYEAVASLQIFPTEQKIVFNTSDAQTTGSLANAFEIYRDTQQAVIKDRWVLQVALRPQNWEAQTRSRGDSTPAIDALPPAQRAKLEAFNRRERAHATNWLTSNLRVSFATKNAQIMKVGLVSEDQEEAAALVNAVVRAYYNTVVGEGRRNRLKRLSQLESIYAEKENEVRNRGNELKATAESLGTSDSETLSMKQQLAASLAAEYQRELIRLRFERDRTDGHLKANKTQLERLAEAEIPEYEVTQFVMNDQMSRELMQQLVYMRQMRDMNRERAVGGSSQFIKKDDIQVRMIESQIEAFNKQMREKIRDVKHAELEKDSRRYEAELAVLSEQVEQFKKDVEKQLKDADQLGRKSVEVEMMRNELKQISQLLGSIGEERDQLRVELNSDPRVQVLGNTSLPAEVPETEEGKMGRIAMALFAALAAMCLPAVGIVLWDVQAGRINAPGEVSQGLGLPVLGSVPLIPSRIIRQIGEPSRRNELWRTRLTEAVDSLTARLLRKSELEQTRVILVTSALAGEGKTTLATQLAMSLARNLRRTVLVDFDLRRPTLDGIFGLSREPGVCEGLRGQGDVAAMAHPTTTEHLSVLTAGRWDRQVLAALGNGGAGPLLDQLRANFDFVILDSSPILPVADTRFVSQKVDGVILSVFRDKSQGPQVLAACEILEAFGVRTVEAVVTGGSGPAYGRGMDYEASAPNAATPSDLGGAEEIQPEQPEQV
jgi:capsular exopolysaccharide synthesis family protein